MTHPDCTHELLRLGKSAPRTCKVCGLGPCREPSHKPPLPPPPAWLLTLEASMARTETECFRAMLVMLAEAVLEDWGRDGRISEATHRAAQHGASERPTR